MTQVYTNCGAFEINEIAMMPPVGYGIYTIDVNYKFYFRNITAEINQQYIAKHECRKYHYSIEMVSEKVSIINGIYDNETIKELFSAISDSIEIIGEYVKKECF